MSFTYVSDVNKLILSNLNKEDFYFTCLINKDSFNLCKSDPILRNQFNISRNLYNEYLDLSRHYNLILSGVNPETRRKIKIDGKLYYDLKQTYKFIISDIVDDLLEYHN